MKTVSKHDQIRTFLQQGLKKYIIKYSDDQREYGYYRDGVLCDVVEIDVTDNEEINWIVRDVTQNIENCTELQQFIVENYLLPEWQLKAQKILFTPIKFKIDWASIDYAAQDFAKAVLTLYQDRSSYVLEEIYQAVDWIATYEDDEVVDAIAQGLNQITIALQPGQDATKKDFDINDAVKCLTLRLCLEADEYSGAFRHKDLIPIIKFAGLYKTQQSKIFKIELLNSAASIYKIQRGELNVIRELLTRDDFWWQPDEKEKTAIELCKKKIDKYYKDKLSGWNDDSEKPEDDDENDEEFEVVVKGWHVIKINKNSLHQERILLLTNKAYWTFNFDFNTGKVDEKHYKRHDLLDFAFTDIGDLDKVSEKISIPALKIYTNEKRKKGLFSAQQEVLAIDTTKKKSEFSSQIRKSINFKNISDFTDAIQKIQLEGMNFEQKIRVKKPKPTRERPSVEGDYSSVFIPYGQNISPFQMKDTLLEIAWCVYAAAVSRQRHKLPEPFINQSLKRPKSGIQAFFYNRLGLGISSGKTTSKDPKKDEQDPREKLRLENEKKRQELEKNSGLKVFQVSQPGQNVENKKLKPLIQKPKPQLDAKCSHDKRIQFNSKCQIFYRDADLVIEGVENLEDNEHRIDFEEPNRGDKKNIVILSQNNNPDQKEVKKEE